MAGRTVEDRLRQEYFELLPDIRRVKELLEAEVRYQIRTISCNLQKYERVEVTSRIKECDSAVDALRRDQEGRKFDPERPDAYTLTALHDLAGVRVLAFPRSRWAEVDQELRPHFSSWNPDHVFDQNDHLLAYTYYGYCEPASPRVSGEYQVVPMLTGLFWQVEHSAIYKPDPKLKGVLEESEMRDRTTDVIGALQRFENEFERLVLRGEDSEG